MEWEHSSGYGISDDPTRLDVGVIHGYLANESYWAQGRSREVVERALQHSVVLGLYAPDAAQAGFCRWVTDQATFAWLCDVFVLPTHRGRGLGTWLIEVAVEHPSVAGLRRQLLATRDAHGLYAKAGFTPLLEPDRWMEARRGGR
jgi:GNAT superfamily N-acetyltransferase